MVATVKIIPYGVAGAAVARAADALGGGALRVTPFRPGPASLILTRTPGMKDSLLAKVRKANGIASASEEKDLVDLKLPYALAVPDRVVALSLDETGKLWIGTPNGLRRFDGKAWKGFDSAGLPSNRVAAVATAGASVWIATRPPPPRSRSGPASPRPGARCRSPPGIT